jgi:hypothetical protein
MQTMTTIGLNIAESVLQVHGVDAGGQVIVRRQLKRRYVLSFLARAPGTGSYRGAMPPAYMKPFGAPRRRVLPVEEGSTQRVVD